MLISTEPIHTFSMIAGSVGARWRVTEILNAEIVDLSYEKNEYDCGFNHLYRCFETTSNIVLQPENLVRKSKVFLSMNESKV